MVFLGLRQDWRDSAAVKWKEGPHMSRVDDLKAVLRRLVPDLPRYDEGAVLDHALHSRGLRTASAEAAAWLSLVAHARHVYTEYDDLIASGYDRDAARFFVVDDLNAALGDWGCRRRVSPEEIPVE